MKFSLTSVLFLATAASALADHTQFVPPRPAALGAATKPAARMPSQHQPYGRGFAHFHRPKPAAQTEASAKVSGPEPARSHYNDHSHPRS
jgi:hypothetical protein